VSDSPISHSLNRLLTASLLLTLSFAEPAPPTAAFQDERPIKLQVDLVTLDAHAFNKKSGIAIKGLTKSDFVIKEKGVRQVISHFSQDQAPLTVLVLIDVSGSVWPQQKAFEKLRNGALQALNLLKPEDEAGLMEFAGNSRLVQPFTRDRETVAYSLARLDGRTLEKGTRVDQGILDAARYLQSASNPDSRRAIIVITDDVNHVMEKRDMAVPLSRSYEAGLRQLWESGAVVCAVLYPGMTPIGDRDPDRSGNDQPRTTIGYARNLAEATGGMVIRTEKEEIPTRLPELIERLRQRYTIGYVSTDVRKDGKFRKINISLTPEAQKREEGATVKTRRGYYAR
jgi:VWFA-related protein